MEALPSLLQNTLPEVPGVGDIRWECDQRLQAGLMHLFQEETGLFCTGLLVD